jgi:hypothetical protein
MKNNALTYRHSRQVHESNADSYCAESQQQGRADTDQ